MTRYFETSNLKFGHCEPVMLVNLKEKVYRNTYGRLSVLRDNEVFELYLTR